MLASYESNHALVNNSPFVTGVHRRAPRGFRHYSSKSAPVCLRLAVSIYSHIFDALISHPAR